MPGEPEVEYTEALTSHRHYSNLRIIILGVIAALFVGLTAVTHETDKKGRNYEESRMKQTYNTVTRYLTGLVLLLGITAASHAAPITLIDQQNQGGVAGTNGGTSFGQSFTPTRPAIDAIEFLMAGLGQSVVVNLLNGLAGTDGMGGRIIATSEPVTVFTPGIHQIIHFDFPTRVALTPGHSYVAQLFTPGGIEGVSWTSGDAYGGGQFLEAGSAPDSFTGRDLIFTEGLTQPIPAPESGWLFSLGLIGLTLATRRNRAA